MLNELQIGFMRNGVLLTEEQPQALIQRYNCSYLEDAFLALCRKQENEAANSKKKRKVSNKWYVHRFHNYEY